MKPFDNYNFRTVAVASILKKDLWPDLHVSRKRTGIDASSKEHGLLDIEFKTTQGSSFMWDKQLEEVRRRQTLASDAFVFGIFEKEILKTILVATEEATLEHIRDLMRKKQAERIQVWEGKIAAGERGGTDGQVAGPVRIKHWKTKNTGLTLGYLLQQEDPGFSCLRQGAHPAPSLGESARKHSADENHTDRRRFPLISHTIPHFCS
jgi:hypothetical protein